MTLTCEFNIRTTPKIRVKVSSRARKAEMGIDRGFTDIPLWEKFNNDSPTFRGYVYHKYDNRISMPQRRSKKPVFDYADFQGIL